MQGDAAEAARSMVCPAMSLGPASAVFALANPKMGHALARMMGTGAIATVRPRLSKAARAAKARPATPAAQREMERAGPVAAGPRLLVAKAVIWLAREAFPAVGLCRQALPALESPRQPVPLVWLGSNRQSTLGTAVRLYRWLAAPARPVWATTRRGMAGRAAQVLRRSGPRETEEARVPAAAPAAAAPAACRQAAKLEPEVGRLREPEERRASALLVQVAGRAAAPTQAGWLAEWEAAVRPQYPLMDWLPTTRSMTTPTTKAGKEMMA